MSRSSWLLRATSAGAVLLTAGVVAALLPGPVEASRTVSQSYPVPASGKLQLTGHGYGHGHGMSQYGARGAARQGLNHRQILAFYYPGTTLATTSGTIRVLISADTDNDVRVLPASGLRIRDTSNGATYALPATAGIKTWRLRTVAGKPVLDYDNGAWHTHRPGGKALAGPAEFYRSGAVVLRVAGTTRSYRGALRLSSSDTVNVLSMDDYVRGVVAREMPASWEAAAVQAQAVAARTYGAWERAEHSTRHYQTCDTTSCQVYGGVASEHSLSNAAVAATANQVLNHQGKPAFTQFSSSSGGWLSAGSRPYLVAKADKYDAYSGNPMHTWTATVTRAAIQKAWPRLGALKRVRVTRRDGNGDWYGRIEQMVLDGSKADVTISGATFRSRFGLRSHWFTFGGGSTTPAPTTEAPAPVSAIMARWRAIGGNKSVVGRPRAPEYSVAGGRARHYKLGRIYAKTGVGAHEVYGRVGKAYKRRGGPTSKLGFPVTKPQRVGKRMLARFEHGAISVRRHGKARVKVTYTS